MSKLTPEEQAAADRRDAQVAKTRREQQMVSRLFMTDAEAQLRAQNHTECTRAGIVNHHEIRSHGDALIAHMKPILDEVNLTGPEALELRREMTRPVTSVAESATRQDQFIEDMRRPIFGTRKVVEAKAAAVKVAAHASPALRQALNTGNAPNSVVLGRALYRRVAEGEPILRNPKVIIK